MKLVRQIVTNKLFLLVVLVGLFLFLSNLPGSTFLQEKQNSEDKNIREEKIVEDTDEKVEIENEIIVEENSPTESSPTPTTAISNNGTIDSFIYPSASISGKSDSSFTIESSDSTDAVTNWYKAKIEELNMNTTSVVTTSTNGNVLNKIAAGDGNLAIEIEISRSNGDNSTKIVGKLL